MLRQIIWIGSSLKDLKEFPEDVKDEIGYIKMEDYIVSSGNIFKDIGYANAEEKFAKTKLAAIINKIIKEKRYTHEEVARILDINQSKISDLENGRLKSFSMECLFSFLEALDQHIEITVRDKSKVKAEQNISVAYL